MHLPIHRKALNSLTWDIWFSLIRILWCSNYLVSVAETPICPASPAYLFGAVPQSYLRCCALGLSPQFCPPNKTLTRLLGCHFFQSTSPFILGQTDSERLRAQCYRAREWRGQDLNLFSWSLYTAVLAFLHWELGPASSEPSRDWAMQRSWPEGTLFQRAQLYQQSSELIRPLPAISVGMCIGKERRDPRREPTTQLWGRVRKRYRGWDTELRLDRWKSPGRSTGLRAYPGQGRLAAKAWMQQKLGKGWPVVTYWSWHAAKLPGEPDKTLMVFNPLYAESKKRVPMNLSTKQK